MNYRDLCLSVFISLKGNFLRSFLSSLGVFMGVFAISGTLQVSDIGKSYIKSLVKDVEAPQVYLPAPYDSTTYERIPYRQEDIDWLKKQLSGWERITVVEDVGYDKLYFDDEEMDVSSIAVKPDYLEVTGRKIIAGSFFSASDFEDSRPIALVDQQLAQRVFRGQNPLQKNIYFQGKSYYIKGVIQLRKAATWGGDQGIIVIPLSVFQALQSNQNIYQIVIQPEDTQNLEAMSMEVQTLMMQRYPNSFLWSYSNMDDVEFYETLIRNISLVLLLIGGIALFVGGVGIANITIASVVERTSEIGLRRAIGATKVEIMLQFLLESTVISLVGGTLAIAAVQGITVVTVNIFSLPYIFNYQTPLISLTSATGVGVLASFLPALRASKLDPVDALRNQ